MITQKGCDGPEDEDSQTEGYRASKAVNNSTSEIEMFSSGEKIYMKGRRHDH